ncbi:LysR family transcriptional regulator [Caballeronia sp. EK]|uniref:LysR family transcriptional regulator n=1 Tax=Caballeronia sp. EK TaxID=2767469 RepID=UPI001655F9BA|nr:LysR family transcriptional regulator [Caballeronia sp. EK]MBC8641369.1 LysR family transcriptional regulator [Caballeronia sp. EK]
MARDNLSDIIVFLAVAREQSFTRAAAKLGVSQSALSHTIRELEARLGVRLLTRTTRSVSMTAAGEALFQTAAPRIEEIDAKLAALSEFSEKPAGLIRITATDHTIDAIVWPKLRAVLRDYPEIQVELTVDYGLVDIVEDRYDMGVRFGDQVAKDMIAVRISADVPMAIVGAPAYFKRRPLPRSPEDLLKHDCITLRLTTTKGIYAWELQKGKRAVQARVSGQMIFNSQPQMIRAALDGYGLAFVPEEAVQPHIRSGKLQAVMKDWCPSFPGMHVYYPSRRQSSRAFTIVLDALRHAR